VRADPANAQSRSLPHTNTQIHQEKKHASMEMCCTDSEEKHAKTLLACHSKDKEEAAKLFDAASQALVERTSMESFHIVFVLDESGSMVRIRESARARATTRAPRGKYSSRRGVVLKLLF